MIDIGTVPSASMGDFCAEFVLGVDAGSSNHSYQCRRFSSNVEGHSRESDGQRTCRSYCADANVAPEIRIACRRCITSDGETIYSAVADR